MVLFWTDKLLKVLIRTRCSIIETLWQKGVILFTLIELRLTPTVTELKATTNFYAITPYIIEISENLQAQTLPTEDFINMLTYCLFWCSTSISPTKLNAKRIWAQLLRCMLNAVCQQDQHKYTSTKAAYKMLMKLTPVVNCTKILWAELSQYSCAKKSSKLKCKYKKALRKTLVWKSHAQIVGKIDTWSFDAITEVPKSDRTSKLMCMGKSGKYPDSFVTQTL